ncbi:MAG: hypothetical protein GWP69_22760 [Gammaproteobacteria bacterium]|nr:hypothetical protein [Gammaproteobacteria bacterium]
MKLPGDLRATLRAQLTDRDCSWSIGGYGAIAEFHWLPADDPGSDCEDLQIVTDAGALLLRLREDVVPHAYQSLSRHSDRWLQGIALCLPWRRARREARKVLTELGPDQHALRSGDRQAVLFDMGLALPHVDACIRSDSPELLQALRSGCGRSLLEPGNAVMPAIKEANPHRVFVSQLGRVEVYQRIGAAGQHPPTPQGPHTHVLPRLLAAGRASAEENDAPAYHRACAYLYPKHPLVDSLGNPRAYDGEAHAHFTALMQRWGDAAFVAERKRAMRALGAGVDAVRYPAPADARGRHALRIAIREFAQQMGAQQMGDRQIIHDWRNRFDRVRPPKHPHLVH